LYLLVCGGFRRETCPLFIKSVRMSYMLLIITIIAIVISLVNIFQIITSYLDP